MAKKRRSPRPKTINKTEFTNQWAAIAGRWQFEGSSAIYKGPDGPSPIHKLGLAIAAPTFRDGVIKTSVRISRNKNTTAGIAVGYQSVEAPYVIAQLGAFDRAYAISEYRPNVGWVSLANAGLLENIDVGKQHLLEVGLAGQSLSFSVDGVSVLNVVLRRPLEGAGVGLFAFDDAEVAFSNITIQSARPRVFVMMPFAEPFDTLYRDVIKPVAEEQLGFEIVRVDEIFSPGIILEDIQQKIATSHAVVAEISTGNPNVFYELGYAHALKKPAVLLMRRVDSEKMPFDVRGYRAIFYDDSIGGKSVVERSLRAQLDAVRKGVEDIMAS